MIKEKIFKQVAKEFQTPAYLFDYDALKERMNKVSELLGDKIHLCYAMKANPFLIEFMQEYVEKLEVCSPGEFAICERAKIPMKRIVLSGVYKEKNEILRVVETYEGAGVYTVESVEQFQVLKKCAKKAKKKLKILIRLSSGNQFGVDEETYLKLLQECKEEKFLSYQGIQYYSGTQKKKINVILKELEKLDTLYQKISTMGIEVSEIEYGPGFYIPYFGEEEQDEAEILKEFRNAVENMRFSGKVTLEMGRFLVASCGYYLTKIVDQKKTEEQNFCIIDGGIHHMNYYGQTMAMKIPHFQHISSSKQQENTKEEEKWNICGSLCTVGDVIVKQLPLQDAQINDILVFEKMGAYSITEGIYLFLSRDLPAVLSYSKEDGLQLLRKPMPTNVINSIR